MSGLRGEAPAWGRPGETCLAPPFRFSAGSWGSRPRLDARAPMGRPMVPKGAWHPAPCLRRRLPPARGRSLSARYVSDSGVLAFVAHPPPTSPFRLPPWEAETGKPVWHPAGHAVDLGAWNLSRNPGTVAPGALQPPGPSGCGGVGSAGVSPLLDDGTASPASRLLPADPTALATRPYRGSGIGSTNSRQATWDGSRRGPDPPASVPGPRGASGPRSR